MSNKDAKTVEGFGDEWTRFDQSALSAEERSELFEKYFGIFPWDKLPARAVGSVTGIGGMAGAIGGMLIATVVGYVLQWTGSYRIPFLISGCAYLLALGVIHLLAPRLEPARIA